MLSSRHCMNHISSISTYTKASTLALRGRRCSKLYNILSRPAPQAYHYTSSPVRQITPRTTSPTLQTTTTGTTRPVVAHNSKLDSQIRTHRDQSHSHSHSHSHDSHTHSHGLFDVHSHSHDNTFLTSKNKADAGVRITRIGLYVNLGMAISKGFGGWYFNSQALVADGVHALTDLVSDFMTLATVSWALKPPTERFPNGFGKIESLGSLGVSGMLLFGGLAMCYGSMDMLYAQLFTDNPAAYLEHAHSHGHGHSHSHSHSHTDLGPNINAAWLAGGSILVKEWLYRATMKIAKQRQSSVLASNAVHHRIDSLTAMVALISISLSNVLSNAAWLDPVGGLLVALMVIRAGWTNSRAALLELADTGLDDDFKLQVSQVAETALTAERLGPVTARPSGKVSRVTGTKSGQNFLVEVLVAVDPKATVEDTMRIEDVVRSEIAGEIRGVKRVKVHCVVEGRTEMDEFVESTEADLGSDSESEHDHNHEHKHDKKDL